MRKITLKKMFSALLLSGCVLCANAAEFYLSPNGNDSNDGKTPTTAKKTLCGIDAVVTMSDTVHVSGIIDITAEPKRGKWDAGADGGELLVKNDSLGGFFLKANHGGENAFKNNWAYVTFLGTNPESDGFDAKWKSRCFTFDGGTFYFRNIGFFRGRDTLDDGGCGIWSRSATSYFVNCLFEGHTVKINPNDPDSAHVGGKGGTNERGGAFMLMNGNVTFHGCTFTKNSQKSGSGMCLLGGTATIEGCTFKDNNSTVRYSNGGGIHLWALNEPLNVIINNSLFINNSTRERGGAIALSHTNVIEDVVAKRRDYDIKVTNCSFLSNESQTGGAIALNQEHANVAVKFLIANCTFYNNTSLEYGGAIDIGGGADNKTVYPNSPNAPFDSYFDIVNSTFHGNKTNGNGGHGPNICTRNRGSQVSFDLKKHFYNSIFDNNYAINGDVTGANKQYNDLSVLNINETDTKGQVAERFDQEFDASNCYIGIISHQAEWLPGNTLYYYTANENLEYTWNNEIGFDDQYGLNINTFSALPMAATSPTLTYGNAKYLTQYNITKDQLGFDYVITDSVCPIGALAVTVKDVENLPEGYFPLEVTATVPEIPLAVKSTTAPKSGVFNFAGNDINLNDASEISVINMAGVTVKTGKDKISLSELPRGVYIVKGKLNGSNRVFVQKFVK